MTKVVHKRNIKRTNYKKILNKLPIESAWLIKLNEGLPHGSFTIIRDRLIEKYGKKGEFTSTYIRLVLNPANTRSNPMVIDEAIVYRDELESWKAALKARIFRA
jgi:hypothetical protein